MPFDGRNRASVLPIRKTHLLPGQIAAGVPHALLLKAGYFVAREQCGGRGAQVWNFDWLAPQNNEDPDRRQGPSAAFEPFLRDSSIIPAHFNRAICQVTFSLLTTGVVARFQLNAGNTDASFVDVGPEVEVATGHNNQPAFIDTGLYAPFVEQGGTHEAIFGVDLSNVTLDQEVVLEARGYAITQFGDPPTNLGIQWRVDAVSLWIESRG